MSGANLLQRGFLYGAMACTNSLRAAALMNRVKPVSYKPVPSKSSMLPE
jgi:hypothetical protein